MVASSNPSDDPIGTVRGDQGIQGIRCKPYGPNQFEWYDPLCDAFMASEVLADIPVLYRPGA